LRMLSREKHKILEGGDPWVNPSWAHYEGAGPERLSSDEEVGPDDGWSRDYRYLTMPDSADSDFDSAIEEILKTRAENARFRVGPRGLAMRRAEEQRLEARRCLDIKYVRLGNYWLEDWDASAPFARAARGAREKRVSALTRWATGAVIRGDFAQAEELLERALKIERRHRFSK
jgi:hypothetical protein